MEKNKLNSGQKQAVTHKKGPALVVAGAGTGKTFVLVERLVYLLTVENVKPSEVLLLTFTDKTQSEMRERVDRALPLGFVETNIHTFHSFGEKILRESALDIGWQPDFKLLSATEQWIFIQENLAQFKLDYYQPLGNPTKFISELVKHFSRLKDEDVSPEEYLAVAKSQEYEDELESQKTIELAEAYVVYNQLLRKNNLADFGDLIFAVLGLFRQRPNILRAYQKQYRYLMIDEFQDTNYCQYQLLKLLSQPENNLMVVGDDNQAIYKFRGASISNILQFKDDFSQAKEIVLNENYRSRQEILDLAYNFIQANNPNTLEAKLGISKKLQAQVDFSQEKETAVQYNFFLDREAEASFVVEKIKELYQKKADLSWNDFAILTRTNDGAESFIKELKRKEIPYQFLSSQGLYYRPLILDIISYLRFLNNYQDSPALFRVLGMEIFKFKQNDLVKINNYARRKMISLFQALEEASQVPDLGSTARKNISAFLSLVKDQAELVKSSRPGKIFLKFIYDSKLLQGLDHDKEREKFSELNQFYKKIKDVENLKPEARLVDLVSRLDLEMEAGDSGSLAPNNEDFEVVKVMTVHSAKGLEFSYVFLADLVDKKFPTIRRGEAISLIPELIKEKMPAEGDYHLEEERRLFYVALTRAKKVLFLSGAQDRGGKLPKKPSRFLIEAGVVSETQPALLIDELKSDLLALNNPEIKKKLEHKPEVFSFSRFSAYQTCPWQYKLSFVLRIPISDEKSSLFFGKMIHGVLQTFLEPLITGEKIIDKKELLKIYEDRFNKEGYRDLDEKNKYYQEGLDSLKAFYKEVVLNPPQPLFLEKDFILPLGNYKIKGTIDRIDQLPDGSLEIVDYKTGRPKTKLEFREKIQLLIYQLFIESATQKKVSRLTFYYLRDGSRLSFQAKDKDLIKVKEELLKDIEAICRGDFFPQPSEINCRYCDFRQICQFRQI